MFAIPARPRQPCATIPRCYSACLFRSCDLRQRLALSWRLSFFIGKLFSVNQTAVALTFLLAILAVSTIWGFAVSAFMSVIAMVALNYFFLPPIGTFTIADPQNWVALVVFLTTSLIAGELGTRARQQTEEAESRRMEVERLYAFSQRLLVSGNVISLLNAIPNHIVETFNVGAAALYLDYKQKFYRSGGGDHFSEEEMKQATAREEPIADVNRSLSFVPVRLGGRAIGSLGISGRMLSRQTLEALGTLDRHRFRARPRGGGTRQDGSFEGGRAAEIRAARFGYARLSNAAHFDQGFGDQPALGAGKFGKPAAGTADCD